MKTRLKEFTIFAKYALVGATGTAVDVGSLYVFVDFFHIPVLVATALSFMLAVINNFFLNKIWTFRNNARSVRKQFIKFFIVSSVGLVLTELCMVFFVYLLGVWYIAAKLATSVIVLLWNFLANKNWTFRDKARPGTDDAPHAFDLTVVVPAFNEARRIGPTLEAIDRYFAAGGMTREIIVIDDGSTDDTAGVVNALAGKVRGLRLLRYALNRGKGHAVKTGVFASRGEYILFTDADNSTPIGEFEKFLPQLPRFPIVIGSRYIAGSEVKIGQPKFRVLIGKLGNFLIRLFLFSDIRDTQCGFKVLQHRAAKEIFSRMKVNRFGFDIELLAIAYLLKYDVREVPVNWYNSPESRMRPVRDTFRTFMELLYIKLNLMSGRYD